jgi:antitoxin (DNA-binding transcriptional repressor) of toxin-antitoxin stability system
MKTVNMLEAKTHLSRLVDEIERGIETEIIIARNGRPAVKLVAMQSEPRQKVKLGLEQGKYPSMSLEEFNATDKEIENLFYGDDN